MRKPPPGIEPGTFPLPRERSARLSYGGTVFSRLQPEKFLFCPYAFKSRFIVSGQFVTASK